MPPFATANVPVISDAPKSTASFSFSIAKPPFAFVSTESVCADVS